MKRFIISGILAASLIQTIQQTVYANYFLFQAHNNLAQTVQIELTTFTGEVLTPLELHKIMLDPTSGDPFNFNQEVDVIPGGVYSCRIHPKEKVAFWVLQGKASEDGFSTSCTIWDESETMFIPLLTKQYRGNKSKVVTQSALYCGPTHIRLFECVSIKEADIEYIDTTIVPIPEACLSPSSVKVEGDRPKDDTVRSPHPPCSTRRAAKVVPM